MAYGFRRELHGSEEATAAEDWRGAARSHFTETCSEVEVEGANQLSKLTPDNTFYNKAPPPRVSMGFPNNGRHSSFKPPQFRGC